jgi:hypothetical protein
MHGRGVTGSRGFRKGVAVVTVAAIALVGSACSKGSSQTTYTAFVQKFRYNGIPTSIKAGNFTVDFSNRESLPITHEMVLIAIPAGKSAQDVIDAAKATGADSEDGWLHFGEIPDVDTGATKAGLFDLPAGTYAFACWQTGNLGGGDGDAHAARGMVFQFSVTA